MRLSCRAVLCGETASVLCEAAGGFVVGWSYICDGHVCGEGPKIYQAGRGGFSLKSSLSRGDS